MAVAQVSLKLEMLSESQEENPELLEMLEKRVLELCHDNLKGITERHIREDKPDLSPTIRMKVINKLLASGKLELCKQGATLVYRLKEVINLSTQQSADVAALDVEQLLVYRTLESVKGSGLISQDIRRRTSLPQVQVTRVLKYLESQGLARSIKLPDQTGPKSKVYLLSVFEPDASLTNREKPLTSHELDLLFQHIHKLLLTQLSDNHHKFFTSQDILSMKTAHIPLSFSVTMERIELVLQGLCDEGKLESDILMLPHSNEDMTEECRYRAKEISLNKRIPAGVTLTPCVMCSLIDRCVDIGNISPNSCLYLKDWLKF